VPQLVNKIVADRAVVAETIGTVNVRAEGISPGMWVDVLRRVSDGLASDQDKTAVERALLAGGSGSLLAFPSATIEIVGNVGELHHTTQLLDASVLERALLQQQQKIDSDRHSASLQAYMRGLRAWANTLPYRLPHQPNADLEALYVPLLAREGNPDALPVPIAGIVGHNICRKPDKPILVLGDAGAGKSTYLRYFARHAWSEPEKVGLERAYLVMPVRMRAFTAEGASVEERLWRILGRSGDIALLGAPPPPGFLSAWSKAVDARWILLLDGLDEVEPELRADAIEWVLQLRDQGDLVTSIFTCRNAASIGGTRLDQVALKVSLEPLGQTQKKELGRKWLNADPEPFIRDVERAGLSDETRIPLVATLAAAIFGAERKLPDTKERLFDGYIALCLDQAARLGGIENKGFSKEHVSHALRYLALDTLENRQIYGTEELHLALTEFLSQSDPRASQMGREAKLQGLSDAIALTGLIAIGPSIHWQHANLRDHLAAKRIAHLYPAVSPQALEVVGRWRDETWRGVLLFLFSIWGRGPDGILATSRLLEDIVYGEPSPQLAKPLPLWKRIFGSGPHPVKRVAKSLDAVLFAIEASAAAGAASKAVVEAIISKLLEKPEALTKLNSCARVFTRMDELTVLARWRGRPSLVGELGLVIEKLEALAVEGDPARAPGALAFIGWIGHGDRLRGFLARPDTSPKLVIEVASRLAVVDEGVLAFSILEEMFDTRIDQAASILLKIDTLVALDRKLSTLIPDRATAMRCLNDRAPSPISQKIFFAVLYIESLRALAGNKPNDFNDFEYSDDFKRSIRAILNVDPEDIILKLHEFKIVENRADELDLALYISEDSELKLAATDPSVDQFFRDYINLYMEYKPRIQTRYMLISILRGEMRFKNQFFKGLSIAAATLHSISRLDVIKKWIMDRRLPAERCGSLTKTLPESTRVQLAHDAEIAIDRRVEILTTLFVSVDPEVSSNAKTAYIEALDRLIAASPNAPEPRRRRASHLMDEQRWADAILDYDWLIERIPNSADDRSERANALYLQGRDDAALIDLDIALTLDPKHLLSLRRKGSVLRYLGRYRESIETLNNAILLGDETIPVIQERARAFQRLWIGESAVMDWRFAYGAIEQVDGKDIEVEYASALVAAGRFMEALPILDKLDRQSILRTWELDDLARCLLKANEVVRALDVAERSARGEGADKLQGLLIGLAARLCGENPSNRPEFRDLISSLNDSATDNIYAIHHAFIAGDRDRLDGGLQAIKAAEVDEASLRCSLWAFDFSVSCLSNDPLASIAIEATQTARAALFALPSISRPEVKEEPAKAIPKPPEKPVGLPGRLPAGLLCRRRAIEHFERENEFAKAVLARHDDRDTLFVFELEDGETVYGQCNFKLEKSDSFAFKFVAPFEAVAKNLFETNPFVPPDATLWIHPTSVARVLFDDTNLLSRFEADKNLARHRRKFFLREDRTAK
jgi:tetratricopeptide (TPR) repeat protein